MTFLEDEKDYGVVDDQWEGGGGVIILIKKEIILMSRPKLGPRCDTTISIPEEIAIKPLSIASIHR